MDRAKSTHQSLEWIAASASPPRNDGFKGRAGIQPRRRSSHHHFIASKVRRSSAVDGSQGVACSRRHPCAGSGRRGAACRRTGLPRRLRAPRNDRLKRRAGCPRTTASVPHRHRERRSRVAIQCCGRLSRRDLLPAPPFRWLGSSCRRMPSNWIAAPRRGSRSYCSAISAPQATCWRRSFFSSLPAAERGRGVAEKWMNWGTL